MSAPELMYNYYFTLTIGLGGIGSDSDVRQ